MCGSPTPEKDRGLFHKRMGYPLSAFLNREDYANALVKQFQENQAEQKRLEAEMKANAVQIEKYQKSIHENQNAAWWGFGRAIVQGIAHTIAGSSTFDDVAMPEDNIISTVADGRKKQRKARDVYPVRVQSMTNINQSLHAKQQRLVAESRIISNDVTLMGYNAGLNKDAL